MNNIGILKKVAQELAKESPKLDYVRGMIDTLIEVQSIKEEPVLMVPRSLEKVSKEVVKEVVAQDEGSILDATAKAALKKTMELAAKSQET